MRTKRLYAPFVQNGKRWERARVNGNPLPEMTKERAIRWYQDWLLAPFFGSTSDRRELRPIAKK